MGPRPQCYIPKLKVIGPLVLQKKIFVGFLPYMGMAAILVMWPRCPQTNFCSPDPWRLHLKSGFDWPCGFGEDLWKWWTDDGQQTDDGECLYCKLINEPKGSGELNTYRKTGNFRVVQFSRNFAVCINPRKLKSAKYFHTVEKLVSRN